MKACLGHVLMASAAWHEAFIPGSAGTTPAYVPEMLQLGPASAALGTVTILQTAAFRQL